MCDRRLPEEPWNWWVIAAFLLAPVIPALVFSALFPAFNGLPGLFERIWRSWIVVVLFGGYVPAFAFGVPGYLILRLWKVPTLAICTLGGAAVAAFPWALLVLVSHGEGNNAWSDGGQVIADGWLTWFGFIQSLQYIGGVAMLGGLGGAVFFLIASAGRPP